MSAKRVNRGWTEKQKQAFKRQRIQQAMRAGPRTIPPGIVRASTLRSPDETYYVDTFVQQTLSTVGVVVPLNVISQGDEMFQREGRKITMLASTIQFSVFMPDTGTPNPTQQTCKVALVYDLHPNQATPLFVNVWASIGNTGVVTDTVFSEANFNNKDRFKILKVWNFMTGTAGFLSSTPLASTLMVTGMPNGIDMPVKYFKRLNVVSQYAGTGAAVPVTGGLFLTHIFDDTAGTWVIHAIQRLSYVA